MILLWVVLGIVCAIAIARLNNSNSLFWIAFTSFAIGIAAESIINKVGQVKEEDSEQVCPTQVVDSSLSIYSLLANEVPTTQSPVPNLVSKDTIPANNGVDSLPKDTNKEVPTDPPDLKTNKND